jgi:hypothetical protein
MDNNAPQIKANFGVDADLRSNFLMVLLLMQTMIGSGIWNRKIRDRYHWRGIYY